jgi:hypothetical protein
VVAEVVCDSEIASAGLAAAEAQFNCVLGEGFASDAVGWCNRSS